MTFDRKSDLKGRLYDLLDRMQGFQEKEVI